MTPRSRRVPGADGLVLHALEWSDEGVGMLLLHGFGNEAHVWDDFAPAMAPYYRTVALDLRGHGDSDWEPAQRYDYESHVRDVEAATKALGIERLVLVGHSLGGRVAMLFAAGHPARMAGLVIVDAGPELDRRGALRIRLDLGRSGTPSFASASEYVAALALAYPAASHEALARLARHGLRRGEDGRLAPKLDPAFRSAFANEPPEGARRREVETTKALWHALARVRCPTLVVRGAASDVLAPETAERMVEEVLVDGRLALVARAGHSVMLDNPDGFREAVTSFALADA